MIVKWLNNINYMVTFNLFKRDVLSHIKRKLPDEKAVNDIFAEIANRMFSSLISCQFDRYCQRFIIILTGTDKNTC